MRRRAPRASVATPPPETELPLASPARQLLLSAGVLLCFGVSSLTQEALTTRTYDGATFRYRNVLLLLQSAASAVVAGAMMLARGPRPRARRPPRGDYGRWAVVVGAYYASHWFGLASLPLLSYPVHVTLKSCKAIPVVVGERLLTARRREPAPPAAGRGYIGVAAMCVGASAFFLLHETAGGARRTTPAGVALVACALVSDGIYGGYQTKLVARCDSEWVLMFYMNAWQALLSACACAAAGGELGAAAAFVSAHPRVARDLALFNVSKALGTLCVYRLLRESGTIVVATVTTLRKVLSVLLSVAYFGHAVGAAQWAALALVFLHAYVGGAIAAVLRVGSD
ncbi:unnamed protein product [Pelagomonas calceolata]|uniref:Uncharacterized protein n=1 Tax=Pelagomonas calceolata TaxID=35677 RepID=A0A8J2SIG3_9STRA|nr:unnamed protein product [Pelagomonas calceolata]